MKRILLKVKKPPKFHPFFIKSAYVHIHVVCMKKSIKGTLSEAMIFHSTSFICQTNDPVDIKLISLLNLSPNIHEQK